MYILPNSDQWIASNKKKNISGSLQIIRFYPMPLNSQRIKIYESSCWCTLKINPFCFIQIKNGLNHKQWPFATEKKPKQSEGDWDSCEGEDIERNRRWATVFNLRSKRLIRLS
jgi:hypothetical protein